MFTIGLCYYKSSSGSITPALVLLQLVVVCFTLLLLSPRVCAAIVTITSLAPDLYHKTRVVIDNVTCDYMFLSGKVNTANGL